MGHHHRTGKRGTRLDRTGFEQLEDLPNVGPAIAAKLRRLGIDVPADLIGRDPYALFEELAVRTGERHDPRLLDVFISAIRFMGGEPARPWWAYTAERKLELARKPPPSVTPPKARQAGT